MIVYQDYCSHTYYLVPGLTHRRHCAMAGLISTLIADTPCCLIVLGRETVEFSSLLRGLLFQSHCGDKMGQNADARCMMRINVCHR